MLPFMILSVLVFKEHKVMFMALFWHRAQESSGLYFESYT